MTSLAQIIDEIKSNSILIPDFQRKFVWSDITMQKKLIASILSSLPIGSFLFLKGNSDEFVSKPVGKKVIQNFDDTVTERKFLLDGQQRMTVLTNVFSNALFDSVNNWSELASDSLKMRYFLYFQNVHPEEDDEDIFGLRNFHFPFKPDIEEPNFLTDKMYDYIDATSINEKDVTNPFHPSFNLNLPGAMDKLKVKVRDENEFRIPLFLLTDTGDSKLRKLVIALANIREEFILDLYVENDPKSFDVLSKMFYLDRKVEDYQSITRECLLTGDSFSEYLSNLRDEWVSKVCRYLTRCINNMRVNIIEVEKSQRARAIDIYENLNRGGISLDTFDLIIAKAAKDLKSGFYEEFIKSLEVPVVPPNFYKIHDSNTSWVCIDQVNVYHEGKNQVASTYLKVFQNLLSLVCSIPLESRDKTEKLKIDLIKREKILALSSEEICSNYKKVIIAENRALCFLQSNCGIRNIDEISYDHLFLGLSYFFYDDSIYQNKMFTNLLECWYWSSIFSGEYDSDQTARVISDLKKISDIFYKNDNIDYIKYRKDQIFTRKFFSDKDTLLMKNAEFEKLPKEMIRKSICQYILSNRPKDFLERELRLSPWNGLPNTSSAIELHHIIPINGAASIKKSRENLRDNKKHLLNSPLNFTCISSDANKRITNFSINDYFDNLDGTAFVDHLLPPAMRIHDEVQEMSWLEQRFNLLRGSMKSRLEQLIQDYHQ